MSHLPPQPFNPIQAVCLLTPLTPSHQTLYFCAVQYIAADLSGYSLSSPLYLSKSNTAPHLYQIHCSLQKVELFKKKSFTVFLTLLYYNCISNVFLFPTKFVCLGKQCRHHYRTKDKGEQRRMCWWLDKGWIWIVTTFGRGWKITFFTAENLQRWHLYPQKDPLLHLHHFLPMH